MYTTTRLRRNQLLLSCLLLALLAQPAAAQQLPADSLLHQSRLYQKGKANIRVGAISLGLGTAITLIGLASPEKKSNGSWQFGPSRKEVAYFFGGLFGFVGVPKLLQGSVRIGKAHAELAPVSYWQAPGQEGCLPALALRWTLGGASAAAR